MSKSQQSNDNEFYLSDVSPKDKPWDEKRSLADRVRDIYTNSSEYPRYAERIASCSQVLEFTLKQHLNGEALLKLRLAFFCRIRFCCICNWRRVLKWRARFYQALPKLQESYPNARWLFLTLTVRNCSVDELKDTLAWMNKAWVRLSQRKQFPGLGWVKSVEVTRSPDGSAHPHFHILIMVSPGYFSGRAYLSQEKWAELWQKSLRVDYTPIVDIRIVKPKPSDSDDTHPLTKAVLETIKYSIKDFDFINYPDWLLEITKQLHKTRAIAIGGVLKQFLSDEEPEDLVNIEGEDEDLEDIGDRFWFGWREAISHYCKIQELT